MTKSWRTKLIHTDATIPEGYRSLTTAVRRCNCTPARGSAGTTARPEEITLPLLGVTATVVYMTHSPSITGRESWHQPRYAMLGMLQNKGASV